MFTWFHFNCFQTRHFYTFRKIDLALRPTVYRLWVHCKRSPAGKIKEKAKNHVRFQFQSSHTKNCAAFMMCTDMRYWNHTKAYGKTPEHWHNGKNRIMIFCYLPQGYPRESYAKFLALENIPSIFQCRSSIHRHCKGLYNRTPAPNSFHRTILDLTVNNEEKKKIRKSQLITMETNEQHKKKEKSFKLDLADWTLAWLPAH